MSYMFRLVAVLAATSISTAAAASSDLEVQPVQKGAESVRYEKGVPTVDLEMHDGVVQITPLPFDHGSLVFGVAVYNDSRHPANMGIEQVHVAFGGQPVGVFTEKELVKKAKHRAMWSQIGLALLGGLAAGASASQRDYYRGRFVTPRGTYTSRFSAPSVAGQFQAAAITASTGYGIASVQRQLDQTIAALGDQVIQLTTVDPGESYAGEFVIDKVKPRSLPATIDVTISWNGEDYPFEFQLAQSGTPAPAFTQIAMKSDLTDFSRPPGAAPGGAVLQDAAVPSGRPEDAAHQQPAQAAVWNAPVHGLDPNAKVHCDTCR